MILDSIAGAAMKRLAAVKKNIPLAEMRRRALEMPAGNFQFETVLREPGISFICEIKKASPSKGVIAEHFQYLDIAREYEAAGASAISILTEPDFFRGNDSYLSEIRQQVKIPLLRKDFTVDEYQLYEAKVLGADAVLLICALLDSGTICRFLKICDRLGISALVEAHTAQEVESSVAAGVKIIGVNNRNLKTFEVNLETCVSLRPLVPHEILYVAESGIKTAGYIEILRQAGVDAVLIGEILMRSDDRMATLKNLRGEGAL